MVAAWCLMAIVFVNSYTSSIVSYLMAPRFLPLINTVQELADSNELQMVIRKFSVESVVFVSSIMMKIIYMYLLFKPFSGHIQLFLKGATSGPLAKLGAFLRAHPENLLPNDENIEDKVYHNRLAFIAVKNQTRLNFDCW